MRLITLFCLMAFLSLAGAQERPPAVDRVALAKLFDMVVDTIEQKFFDSAKLKDIDWGARARAARPSVIVAPSMEEAVRRINTLLSELKTSHTRLFTPDEYDYYALLDIVGSPAAREDMDAATFPENLIARRFWGSGPYYLGTGAFTRDVDGHHFIDGILEGSPAERAGLRYGDEILSVDGKSYNPILAFRGKVAATADLLVRDHAGARPEHVAVSVVPIRPTTAFSAATISSAKVLKRNGSRIGYIHVWASNESDSFDTALTKLKQGIISKDSADDASNPIDSLVIDIRGRVGGRSNVPDKLLQAMDAPQTSYVGRSWLIGRSGVLRLLTPGPARASFRGRSALLIDSHTRSAAEIMAYGYKRSSFGSLVGTRTAGAVSAGGLFVMPGDLLLYVAVSGLEFEDVNTLEGVGVQPDYVVERPLPYAAGADPVLDKAVELLSSKPAQQ
jgi:carboxyl-terminal processing protease